MWRSDLKYLMLINRDNQRNSGVTQNVCVYVYVRVCVYIILINIYMYTYVVNKVSKTSSAFLL